MKKVLSLFLSLVMLFTITAEIDFSSLANNYDEITVNSGWQEYFFNGDKKILCVKAPSDGILNVKIMHYMHVGIAVDNNDFSVCLGGEYYMDTGSTDAPSTDMFNFSVSKGLYYITLYNGDSGKFKLNLEFSSYGNNETEPNDFDKAMLLTLNKEITGAFTYDDDLDWYKINIPYGSNLKLSLRLYTGVRFYVYNSDLSVCYIDDYYNSGGNMQSPTMSIYNTNINKGVYYVKIICPSNYGKYKISCSITCNSHKYTTKVVKPTYTSGGYTLHTCTRCKKSYKDKKTKKLVLKNTSISKITAGKKAFTIKWKKQSAATGYQIQYSTSSKFKGAKTLTVSKNKTTSKKISKLKAKKKYYVRIRTYKTVKVNGKNTKVYSGWSKVKMVKTK